MPRIIRKGYKQLTKLQKLLYIYLRDLCGEAKGGICYRTLRTLADETDFSTGYLSENIPILAKAGLIKAHKQKRNDKKWEIWHISIVDIWDLNTKFIEAENRSRREQLENNRSSDEQNNENCSPDEQNTSKSVHDMNELDQNCSHGETEEEKGLNKNPSLLNKKESTPPGSTQPNVPSCIPSSTSLLENLTEEERQFWQLWSSRPFNKIAPKLNETAYKHVQALAPHVTTDEQIDSLIAYSKKKLEKRGITDAVKLGNMNSDHNDWLQTRPKPKPEKNEPPASKEKLILWTRTPEDSENVEKFKHTRRGQVDEWEALRDSINWEWVTEDEARQHGWEEGRGFTDRERRELFAAKEAKELILWTEEPDHLGDPVANWYKYKMMTRGEAREKYKLDYYDELPAGVVVDIQHKFKLEELGHIKRPVLVAQ